MGRPPVLTPEAEARRTAGQEKSRRVQRQRKLQEPLSEKQRQFIRLVAEGETKVEAYLKTYGSKKTTAKNNAYKIFQKQAAKDYYEQCLREAGKRHDVTMDEIIHNLRRARDEAFSEGRLSDAIRATEQLGAFADLKPRGDRAAITLTANPFARQSQTRIAMIAGIAEEPDLNDPDAEET